MSMNPISSAADYMFGPSGWSLALLWPLLTSAMRSRSDCSNPQPIRLARDAPGRHGRSPRVSIAASAPHPPHLLRYPLMAMGFALTRKLTRISQPFMRFVSLGSELCLGLPSDPTSRWTPLPLASSFRHQDLQGTLTPKPLHMPGTRESPPAEREASGSPLEGGLKTAFERLVFRFPFVGIDAAGGISARTCLSAARFRACRPSKPDNAASIMLSGKAPQ